MKYNHIDMLPEKAFQPIGRQMTLEGGSSPSAPTSTTVTNTNIPDYAQPYVQNMLNAAQSQIYNPAGTGFNAYVPYSSNPSDYVAGFSPLQQQAQSAGANLQVPGQLGAATSATNYAIGNLANAQYTPQTGGYLATSAPSLSNYTMSGASANAATAGAAPQSTAAQLGSAPQINAAQFRGPQNVSASNVSAPSLSTYQMGGINAVSAPGMQTANMQAAQTGYNPQLTNYQMTGPSQVTTQDFTQPGTAQQYMNPYLSASLAPQLAEIQRQYGVTGQQEQAGATQAGAFGGSREALMAAENQRNSNTAQNAAITQGYNTAFNNAQAQFNAQQQAGLQAQTANQQAGLTTGTQNLQSALGVQQLGANTGLQTSLANLSNAQQANVQNQAAQLQASGMNATQAMQAALANQTMGYNVGNTNLQAALGTQQLGATQGLAAQQANQQAGLQAGLANQTMGYNTGLQNAQMSQQAGLANQALAGQYGLQNATMAQQSGLANQALAGQYGLQNAANTQQANLANQQAQMTTSQQNLQANLATQNLAATQALQSQQANQQAVAAAQQLAAQQQQFGANNQLANQQAILSGANQLGNLGTSDLAAQTSVLGTQNALGAQQQAQQQSMINQAISNYATAQQYPYMQLGTLNSMLRGLPMQAATTQMYQAAPSAISQAAGLGTAALGASSLLGHKDGGLMSVKKMAMGGSAIPMNMMSPQQLQQVQHSPAESAIGKVVAQGQMGLNNYISQNPQSAKVMSQPLPLPQQQPQQPPLGMPPQLPTQQAKRGGRIGLDSIATGDMTKMAGGGILAFGDGTNEKGVPKPDVIQNVFGEGDSDTLNKTGIPHALSAGFGALQDIIQPAVKASAWPIIREQIYSKHAPATTSPVKAQTAKLAPTTVKPATMLPSDLPDQATPVDTANPVSETMQNPLNVMHTQFGDMYLNTPAFKDIDLTKGTSLGAIQENLANIQKGIEERKSHTGAEALTRLGLGLMAAPNRTGHNFADALSNLGTAGTGALNYMGSEDAANAADLQRMTNLKYEAQKADQARDLGFMGTAAHLEELDDMRKAQLKQIDNSKELALNEKKQAREDLNSRYASGLYLNYIKDQQDRLRSSGIYPSEDVISNMATTAAYNYFKNLPEAKYLNLTAPPPLPIAPPKAPGFFERINPFSSTPDTTTKPVSTTNVANPQMNKYAAALASRQQ